MAKEYNLIENVFVLPEFVGHREDIKTESFKAKLYMDAKDSLDGDGYQPGKIYITKQDKKGNVKIIIEHYGIYWLDCEQPFERLEKEITPERLSKYIHLLVCSTIEPISKKNVKPDKFDDLKWLIRRERQKKFNGDDVED